MDDQQQQPETAQQSEHPGGAAVRDQFEDSSAHAQPSEAEMRAAYEAELNRITSSEMILQTTVSLLNIGGRRLGLAGPSDPQSAAPPAAGQRDLEQVRDAIDGARALMPILERHMAGELGPLRDAVSQLQMAYAREVQGERAAGTPPTGTPPTGTPPAGSSAAGSAPSAQKPAASADAPASADTATETSAEQKPDGPGPAQASGRLWVPGQ